MPIANRLLASLAAACAIALWTSVAEADWDSKQLHAVRVAPTSLRQAVSVAERELKGRALIAESQVSDSGVTYTVKVDGPEKVMTAIIDAKTGKITETSTIEADNALRVKDYGKLKGTLLAAMKAAEATAKGKSFFAAFRRQGGKDLFEVDVAGRDDDEKDVIIDAASEKIRKVTDKTSDQGAAANGASPAAGAAAPAATTP